MSPSSASSPGDSSTPLAHLPKKIFIIYASQTGQAESITKLLYEQFISGILRPITDQLGGEDAIQLYCVSKYEEILGELWQPKETANLNAGSYLALIVASTTGQGDPPDKALKFERWLRRLKRSKKGNELSHLSYALLGLGDTNYDNFANFGHVLDRHLIDLGAQPFVTTEYADDAVCLETVTEPFMDNLTQTLLQHFGVQNDPKASHSKPAEVSSSVTSEVSKTASAMLPNRQSIVSSCASLTPSDKETLADLSRLLTEPSEKLKDIPDGELTVPKLASATASDATSQHNCLLTAKQLSVGDTANNDTRQVVSCYEYLKSKVPAEVPFYEGTVKLTQKLSIESEQTVPKRCLHQEKIVLECTVQCQLPKEQAREEFVPGDAYGIYTSNLLADVYQVLQSALVVKTDTTTNDLCSLWQQLASVSSSKTEPVYITLDDKQKSTVELLPYLVYGVDLRSIPKKACLATLAQYTTDSKEKRRLLELASRQGSLDYQNSILAHKVSVCDILRLFESCRPPISVLLSQLTAARPRYFSSASLPEDTEDGTVRSFKIVLSICSIFTHSFRRYSEQLLGLFSGKFFQHYTSTNGQSFLPDLKCTNVWQAFEHIHSANAASLANSDVPLLDERQFPAYIFPRAIKSFRVTRDTSKPLILLSTGTGIAPFLSLLEERQKAMRDGAPIGEITFIFGCRNPVQDFTYAKEMIAYSKGDRPLLKHLCLCFSRATKVELAKFEMKHNFKLCTNADDEVEVKHVNQMVEIHGQEIVHSLVEKEAHVYICGDWKKLSTGLAKTFTSLLSQYYLAEEEPSATSPEAVKYLKELQKNGRYCIDVWT